MTGLYLVKNKNIPYHAPFCLLGLDQTDEEKNGFIFFIYSPKSPPILNCSHFFKRKICSEWASERIEVPKNRNGEIRNFLKEQRLGCKEYLF